MFDPPPVIGQCIYCGRTDGTLTDEHIIPYGLNGSWKLVRASCVDCARITSQFEREVLRKALDAPRAALGLRSYRKKRRPTSFPLAIDRGAGTEQLNVLIDEHPAIAVLPRYAPATWLTSRVRASGISVVGANSVYFGRIPLPEFVEKFKGTKLTGTVTYEPTAFAKLVAKIALGYCAGRFGFEAVRSAYITSAILGHSDDIGTWVGSTEGYQFQLAPELSGRVMHAVGTDVVHGDIVAYVRLFAWAVPDEYLVVVGPVPTGPDDPHAQGRGGAARGA